MDAVTTYLRNPRRLVAGVARRLFPGTHFGLTWRTRGQFVTFTEAGFVTADSPAFLLARHHYETQYLRRALTAETIQRSLEIGCGFGRLTPTITETSNEHTAIDINEKALALARTCYPLGSFVQASATSLPFPDAYFDLVSTWTVLQHIRPGLIESALKEIRRVLRTPGMVVMCEETRNAGATSHHAWHRTSAFYAKGLQLSLEKTSHLTELERISVSLSPGELMILRNSRSR